MKQALIVGCEGQDGSYLAEHLTSRGYSVTGIDRIARDNSRYHVDIRERLPVRNLIRDLRPDEIYYLAAFHHSSENLDPDSGDLIRSSFEINVLALNNVLDAMTAEAPAARLFYASSSHVFGVPLTPVQNEETPMNPIDPYGISKAAGMHLCRHYRERKGLFCAVGILYNHESPRRSPAFLSRKVVKAAVDISRHLQDRLFIGNPDALVDWGFAPDYVDAMWRMLQLPQGDTFVVSSGVLHSVRDLLDAAFEAAGLDWHDYVQVDPEITRKPFVQLQGDHTKLTKSTGWKPVVAFGDMIRDMVNSEMRQ